MSENIQELIEQKVDEVLDDTDIEDTEFSSKEEIIEAVKRKVEKEQSNEEVRDGSKLSRRGFLKTGALGLGALALSSNALSWYSVGGGGGSSTLSDVLSNGNSAGSYSLDMNSNSISNVAGLTVNNNPGNDFADIIVDNSGTNNAAIKLDSGSGEFSQLRFYEGGAGKYMIQSDPGNGRLEFIELGNGNIMSIGSSGLRMDGGTTDLSGNDLEDGTTTIWDTSNSHIPQARIQQGAGSGLNADTVDGKHASDFATTRKGQDFANATKNTWSGDGDVFNYANGVKIVLFHANGGTNYSYNRIEDIVVEFGDGTTIAFGNPNEDSMTNIELGPLEDVVRVTVNCSTGANVEWWEA